MRRLLAAVVYDHHLKVIARIVDVRYALQAGAEVSRPAKRWYDNGEANTIDPQRARSGIQVVARQNCRYRIALGGTVPAPTGLWLFQYGPVLLATAIKNALGDGKLQGTNLAPEYKSWKGVVSRRSRGRDGDGIVRRNMAGVNTER